MLFSPETTDISDISFPHSIYLREEGVTFQKTAMGHLKEGVWKSKKEKTEGFTGYCWRKVYACVCICELIK